MKSFHFENLSICKSIEIPTEREAFYKDLVKILKENIPEVYLDDSVVCFLKKLLFGKCTGIGIEYPYYDEDYLSMYYTYYSKCFRPYKKECCRLLLFGNDRTCIGYITLRPLPKIKKIGKSYLSPIVFAPENCYVICGQYKVHYQGAETTIEAMPYMQQEKRVAVCGHVSLWSTIRFFASRFANHANQTIGNIVECIESPSERKIPSQGVTPTQISTALMKSGFGSIILRRDSTNTDEAPLYEQVCAYLDSGLPVICVSSSSTHAVVACGRAPISAKDVDSIALPTSQYIGVCSSRGNSIRLAFESAMVNTIIVNDDNELPYSNIKVQPSDLKPESEIVRSFSQIDICIVPLDDDMKMTYSAAKDIFQIIFHQTDNHGKYLYSWTNDEAKKETDYTHFAKISLVSANTFKEWIRENIEADNLPTEFMTLLKLDYPKFLWLGEFSSLIEYKDGTCSGFILLDSTCTAKDLTACLLVADNQTCCMCKYTSYSEDEIMQTFNYDKFNIPLFRKNYMEVNANAK